MCVGLVVDDFKSDAGSISHCYFPYRLRILMRGGPTAAKRNIRLYGESNAERVMRLHFELFGNRDPLSKRLGYNPSERVLLAAAFNKGRAKEDQRTAPQVFVMLSNSAKTKQGRRQISPAKRKHAKRESARGKQPSDASEETQGKARKVQKIDIEIDHEQDELPEVVEAMVA